MLRNILNFRRHSTVSVLDETIQHFKNKCLSGDVPSDIMDILHQTGERMGITSEVIEGRMLQYGKASVIHNYVTTSLCNNISRNLKKKFIVIQDCTIYYHNNKKGELTHDIVVLKCSPKDLTNFLIPGSTMRLDAKKLPVTLVVETLSPESGKKDRIEARSLCEAQLYNNYWLVDPLKKLIETYKINDLSKYDDPEIYKMVDNNVIHNDFLIQKIKLSDIFVT